MLNSYRVISPILVLALLNVVGDVRIRHFHYQWAKAANLRVIFSPNFPAMTPQLSSPPNLQ